MQTLIDVIATFCFLCVAVTLLLQTQVNRLLKERIVTLEKRLGNLEKVL